MAKHPFRILYMIASGTLDPHKYGFLLIPLHIEKRQPDLSDLMIEIPTAVLTLLLSFTPGSGLQPRIRLQVCIHHFR